MPSGLSDTERAVLGDALKVLERMEHAWPSIAQLWEAAPQCVVHGDFIDKNVLIDETGDSPHTRPHRSYRDRDHDGADPGRSHQSRGPARPAARPAR